MKTALLSLLLVVGCAHADTILKNAGTTVGPINTLECNLDGGLVCTRAPGGTTGKLTCATASQTTSGCVSTGNQDWSGTKTINGGLAVNGAVWIDAGTVINSTLRVDGGLTVKSGVSALGYTATGGTYFGNTRVDGGVGYLDFGDPTGKPGFPLSPGLTVMSGISLAQVGHLGGFRRAGAIGGRVVVTGSRFMGPAQFLRLSGTVVTAGVSDGGLQVDGGASQSFFIGIYNLTTGQMLCTSSDKQCQLTPGFFGGACAADAGARVAAADDIELTVYDADCLISPEINISAEYGGLP